MIEVTWHQLDFIWLQFSHATFAYILSEYMKDHIFELRRINEDMIDHRDELKGVTKFLIINNFVVLWGF